MPVEEVAQVLGCRAGTVKSRAHRALRQLARSDHLSTGNEELTGVQSNGQSL
jgi:hypothetical protein